MPVLTRRIDVGAPLLITYNRFAQLDEFAKFLSEVLPAATEPGYDDVHRKNPAVELCEQIPYTQIGWRISGLQNSGRLTLSLIREIPDKVCRISFELEILPPLSDDGHKSLLQRIDAALQRLKQLLEGNEGGIRRFAFLSFLRFINGLIIV